MATIERQPAVRSIPHEAERPVFLAADGRRARRLRVVAFAVTVLAVLWLVALAAGTLGFGSLPGISVPELPKLGGATPPPGPDRARQSDEEAGTAGRVSDVTVRSGSRGTTSRAGVQSAPQRPATTASTGKARLVRTHPRRPAQPAQPATPVQPPAQPVQPPQAQAPPPPATGRERRGLPAPPGHARKTEPAETAPPLPGNRRGQETTPPPPAPPPPPPGNGHGGGPKK
jgi:hypothetical protein